MIYSSNTILSVFENLVAGKPVNVIRVPEREAVSARMALERMLAVV